MQARARLKMSVGVGGMGTPSNEPNVPDDGRRFQFGLAQPLARTSGAPL